MIPPLHLPGNLLSNCNLFVAGERKISLHIPGSRLQGHQFAMHQPYKPDGLLVVGANETNKLKLPVSINYEDANLSTNEDEDIVVIEEFDD